MSHPESPKRPKPFLHIPKWMCVGAVLLASAALVIQAAIDVYQGTRDMAPWSTEWLAQAWQMALVTGFIMSFAAFGGRLLNARRWIASAALYALVFAFATISVNNSMDFMADNTLATGEAVRARAVQSEDIASIKNKIMLEERKETLENQWRTYYAAKTPTDKERALAQIQSVTKEGPALVTADVQPVKLGSGGIWNRWLGWRQEAVQEAKTVALPILIMIGKALGITLGFACWPQAGQLPPPVTDTQNKVNFGLKVAKFSKAAARSDVLMLVSTGALNKMDVTGTALADRWHVSAATSSNWLREFRKEGIILRERVGERNRLAVKAPPSAQVGEAFVPAMNGNGRAHA